MSGSDGFELQRSGARRVAQSLVETAELTARAGTTIAGLPDEVIDGGAGRLLHGPLVAFADDWTAVLDDVGAALLQLSEWIDDAVTCFFTVDDDAAYRFGPLPP